jgi:cation diffusion facilitator family transporter
MRRHVVMRVPMTSAERFALGSLCAGCVVLGLKGAAWGLTGSAALYSDALESTVNVVASLVAWMSLRLAARPSDANHPYGHDKAEFFAAIIEGMMIIVAALLIFAEAWHGWRNLHPIAAPFRGIGLSAVATVINGAWSLVLLSAGRRLRSPALQADGKRLFADVMSSVGITLGVLLAVATGWFVLDPLLAMATGVYVLWSGTRLISTSVSGLMDEAPEPAVVDRIEVLVANSASGAIEAHDFRSRHDGRLTFLEYHLVVPGSMTVAAAHTICDRIEDTLRAEMGRLMVTIHVEPEELAKPGAVRVP